MNYSRIRTANPLALGLEMSSLALFFLLLSPAPLDSLHLLPFLNCINYSGLLINNTDLCRQEVQAWWGGGVVREVLRFKFWIKTGSRGGWRQKCGAANWSACCTILTYDLKRENSSQNGVERERQREGKLIRDCEGATVPSWSPATCFLSHSLSLLAL